MTKNQQGEKSGNPLEQFVLLSKSAKGAAASELVKQALECPGVYVFGELLDMPNIQELEKSQYSLYFNTLNLFAYGTYTQYLENQSQFIELTPNQKKKLQHLTIVTLATRVKCIPYTVLLKELDVKNVRDLEDLIIEAIYSDIIQGKLDQKNSQLEVDFAIGRDIKQEEIGAIIQTLQEWCSSCEAVLGCIEDQVQIANNEKTARNKHKETIVQNILAIKKKIKAASESEENLSEAREAVALSLEKAKRSQRGGSTSKGTGKTNTKFWNKS